MELFIVTIFEFCVEVMRASANLTGLSYKEVNTIVFLIIEPALVIIFFTLWRYEKYKSKSNSI